MLRVAVVGVGHWHAPFYFEPLANMQDILLCGVSDPDSAVAQRVARRLNCPSFSDHVELLSETQPDFVFALGPHNQMPVIGRSLIAAGVSFCLEKPCGTALAQVMELRDLAAAGGLFATVPFAFRCSDLLQQVRETAGLEDFRHMSFRFIAGTPSRYLDAGCAWMLDPRRSGGGCTINLAVHFFDLFKLLTGAHPTVVGSVMSRITPGIAVEDYSAILLRSGTACGVVETGYTLPAPTAVFDLRFSLRSQEHYFAATGADVVTPDRLVTYALESGTKIIATPASQVPYYARFVAETLDRFRNDQAPIADLSDMCDAMSVVESAYAIAGFSEA